MPGLGAQELNNAGQESRGLRPSPAPWLWLSGVTLAVGLLAGGAVAVVAFYLARYGPAGNGWSFRGNGALAAFALVPALLTAGWTALVLRARSYRSWHLLGLGAGLVGTLLAAADAALLPVFGSSADRIAGPILLLGLLAWTVAAPILASKIAAGAKSAGQSTGSAHLVAGVVWFVAMTIGLMVGEQVIPAGS
ncbi:MAG TPA: hypothetical protein VJT14_01545 [Candidatus Dormibacteraeota bacterium]|nr:hypothetical protein [Candidatus Dormibacteraeota bacterium]